jgi:organic hydroperoxide reductase OsmC/OhrA
MNISAKVINQRGEHTATLCTAGHERSLNIPPKPEGFGSRVNGGELLFLALATCYCNDLYREAKKRNMIIEHVQAEVSGEFGGEGEGARNISYRAFVVADAPENKILELMRHTDSVAEIHNTLRGSTPVVLAHCEAHQQKP